VRIDDNLTQRVIQPDRLTGVCRDVLQQTQDSRNARRMNAVLRLLKAQYALGLRVQLKDRQGKEA